MDFPLIYNLMFSIIPQLLYNLQTVILPQELLVAQMDVSNTVLQELSGDEGGIDKALSKFYMNQVCFSFFIVVDFVSGYFF